MKNRRSVEVVREVRRVEAVVGGMVESGSSLATVGTAAAAGRLAAGRGNGQAKAGVVTPAESGLGRSVKSKQGG
jgi:hypothetical protein